MRLFMISALTVKAARVLAILPVGALRIKSASIWEPPRAPSHPEWSERIKRDYSEKAPEEPPRELFDRGACPTAIYQDYEINARPRPPDGLRAAGCGQSA